MLFLIFYYIFKCYSIYFHLLFFIELFYWVNESQILILGFKNYFSIHKKFDFIYISIIEKKKISGCNSLQFFFSFYLSTYISIILNSSYGILIHFLMSEIEQRQLFNFQPQGQKKTERKAITELGYTGAFVHWVKFKR